MRRRFTLPLLSLALLTLPVAADPRPDILYTSRKEFVRVSPAHQLTLNAHIDKFAYDPLGLEVACTGSETQGDQTTYFVKTLDARTGKELHRLTLTVPQDTDARLEMLGWTPSGKYLLLERTQPRDEGEGTITRLQRWDLSADPPKLRPVEEAFPVPEGTRIDSLSHFASPQGGRVLLVGYYALDNKLHSVRQVYDAEQNRSYPLPHPEGVSVSLSWADDFHLLARSQENEKRQQINVITGQLSPVPPPVADFPPASRQFPDLSLMVDYKTQVDSAQSGAMASKLIWVRCDLRQKQPLSTVGTGIMMGADDPKAVWSPAGKQIAYLNRGDLYVSDVALVPASESLAGEKYALGLRLSCPEERELAASNMKQIGLGLLQYSQDYDETYPPAGGVDEAITPYIKDRAVFSVGTTHWAYHAPKDLSVAAMESPADTVLGTMTLPCGQIVLYGDGHVKIMTGKEEAP